MWCEGKLFPRDQWSPWLAAKGLALDELLKESKRLPEPMAPLPVLGIQMLAPPLPALPFIPDASFWEFLNACRCDKDSTGTKADNNNDVTIAIQ